MPSLSPRKWRWPSVSSPMRCRPPSLPTITTSSVAPSRRSSAFQREDALEALRREAESAEHRALAHAGRYRRCPACWKARWSRPTSSTPSPKPCAVRWRPRSPRSKPRSRPSSPSAPRPRRIGARASSRSTSRSPAATCAPRWKTSRPITPRLRVSESYLKAAARDLVRNAGLFIPRLRAPAGKLTRCVGQPSALCPLRASTSWRRPRRPAARRSPRSANPTYANLFGRIEQATDAERRATSSASSPAPTPRQRRLSSALRRCAAGKSRRAGRVAARTRNAGNCFDPPASPVGAVGDEVPDLEPIPLNV